MKILEKFTGIDRRIIFLVIAVVVIVPLVFSIPGDVRVMAPAQKLFDAVDSIPDDKILIVDFDYSPQTQPENEPMAIALLRHAFAKRIRVAALSLYVQPLGLAAYSRFETHRGSKMSQGRQAVVSGCRPGACGAR